MARQIINIGSSPNKGDGDALRVAFEKVNNNFDELYNELGPQRDIVGVEIRSEDSTVLVDAINSTVNLNGTLVENIVPRDNLALDLGNEQRRFDKLYGSVVDSNSTVLVNAETGSINLDGTVKGNIIPDAQEAYDIGSTTNRFKDLYLSGNTIFLGDNAISVDPVTGAFEFTGEVRQVVVTQRDIVGNVFAQDSTLVVDGITGEVKNLGGELPSYYLDYNNFTNVPTLTLTDILENGGVTDNSISVAEVTAPNITGDSTGAITDYPSITTSVSGSITGYSDIDGSAEGDITGYNNIIGNNLGDIGGYVNVRARDSFIVNSVSFGSTEVNNWNTAYSWGDHGEEGYATVEYVDDEVANVLVGAGFATFWNNQFITRTTDDLVEGDTNLYFTESRVNSILTNELNPYATQSFVTNQISTLRGSAPSDLNTLQELAAAVGNNAGFSTYVDGQLALKLNSSNFASEFDARFSSKTTDNLSEGSNLYYTDVRVGQYLTANNFIDQTGLDNAITALIGGAPGTLNTLNEIAAAIGDDPAFSTSVNNQLALKLNSADFNGLFDTRFSSKNTSDISEGVNKYFTDARARQALSVVEAGGDGSLTYNISTGAFTYTGPSADETRAHFSATGDISYDDQTGVFSFNNSSGYLTEVAVSDVSADAIISESDSFENSDSKLMTAAAIDNRIDERVTLTSESDTLQSVINRGNSASGEIVIDTVTVSSINAQDSSTIDFGDTQLENVIIDFGTY